MSQQATLVTPEVLSQKGKLSEWRTFPEPVDRGSIRRFAIAIMDESPEYRDEAAAREAGYEMVVAPPTYVGTSPKSWGSGGYLKPLAVNHLKVPGIRKAVGGGVVLDIFRPVQLGDVISSRTRIRDIYEKQGRNSPMVFIVQETVYVNQHRHILALVQHTEILLP